MKLDLWPGRQADLGRLQFEFPRSHDGGIASNEARDLLKETRDPSSIDSGDAGQIV
jgi:hypothetical protein